MLLPTLCFAGLFIVSMIIKFVNKMKVITAERYQEAPSMDFETRTLIQEMMEDDAETFLAVDEHGRLVEVHKHPI
jgi:formate-dependent phosphoribosylglycinamide formyltransferase (GAR transformylase)